MQLTCITFIFGELIAIRIVTTIFEPEGPLEAREWNISERGRKYSEKLIRTEYSIQVVTGLREAQLDRFSILIPVRPELNCSLSIKC